MRNLVICLILAAMAGSAFAQSDEKVYYDAVDEKGNLSGGFTYLPRADKGTVPTVKEALSTTLVSNGDPANRIDLVILGDGYTASELDLFATQVDGGIADFFSVRPFYDYENFFNVHRVDVISNESGVDNDPVQGVLKDTAMDMGFWCAGIERLLCVDVALADAYAATAPDRDQVLVLGNSSKYGGAGYPSSDLATASGGNDSSLDVVVHEFGHSIGDLADEYDYADGAVWSGPEPGERNISILQTAAMQSAGTKWAPWLGYSDLRFDGLIDTYEGAEYTQYGIYRPTSNSMMRSLGRPFNLPSIEGLVIEMYKTVRPVDDSTPTGQLLAGNELVFVDPVDPVNNPLAIQWSLDGSPIVGATSDTLDLTGLGLALGAHILSVTVVDQTTYVRDEAARAAWMTETLTWDMQVDHLSAVAMPGAPLAATNHPNPFNPRTVISFNLPGASAVQLEIYDASGRLVRRLTTSGRWTEGYHEVVWDGRNDQGQAVGSGIYLYRLQAGLLRETHKMALLR